MRALQGGFSLKHLYRNMDYRSQLKLNVKGSAVYEKISEE